MPQTFQRAACLCVRRRLRWRLIGNRSDHIRAIFCCEWMGMFEIRSAQFPADADEVLGIWREYISSTKANLDYQGYEIEFASLPGKYGAPEGRLLLGEIDHRIVGCVGLRRVSSSICEMKRLYLRPVARGLGLGGALVERLIREARSAGYSEMRLDVLAEFEAAQRLYANFGFEVAEPVSHNPTPGAQFLGRRLD